MHHVHLNNKHVSPECGLIEINDAQHCSDKLLYFHNIDFLVISHHSTLSQHTFLLNHYFDISTSASCVTCSSSTTKKSFKHIILYNKNIADARPDFLLGEAILCLFVPS